MLWRIPVDTHAQRIDRWPPPDNRRATNPNTSSSPITIACWAPPTRCWARRCSMPPARAMLAIEVPDWRIACGNCGNPSGRSWPALGRFLDTIPGDVERRQEQQGQQGGHDDAADHGEGHRAPEDLARDRDHAQAGGGCGEQDGPHAVQGGFDHGVPW